MANEPLRIQDADGDLQPIPQAKKKSASVTVADGDETVWAIPQVDGDGDLLVADEDLRNAVGTKSDAKQTDPSLDASQIAVLKGVLDLLGSTLDVAVLSLPNVTVSSITDSVDLGSLNGAATESTLADQESYDEFVVGPATDSVFNTPYNGVIVSSVDGDIEIQTGAGNTKTIPQGFLVAGQVLPVTVAEISSTDTTQTVSNIMLVRN